MSGGGGDWQIAVIVVMVTLRFSLSDYLLRHPVQLLHGLQIERVEVQGKQPGHLGPLISVRDLLPQPPADVSVSRLR